MPQARIRLALIGCGGIAKGHIAAYKRLAEHCQLAYCVDSDEARARAFAAEGECGWATDYRHILGEVDAVDICTPPHLHAPIALAAAGQGKHVLTEKVMATTLADADEMIRVADANSVKLMVAYVNRFDPIWMLHHDLVRQGKVGRPYLVTCRTEHFPGLAAWRASWDTFPMGALLSHGCHYVDHMLWCFGEIAAVTSVGANSVRGPALAREDTAVALFRFGNGMLGNLVCSWAARHTNHYIEFNVYGTEGFLQLTYDAHDGTRRLTFIANDQTETLYEWNPRTDQGDGPKNFVGECEHFIECIRLDREPLTSGRESRKSLEALLAAYQGDDDNRIVWLAAGEQYAARPGTISAPAPVPSATRVESVKHGQV